MTAVPIKFRNLNEKNIISYDYTDISTGAGIVKFYCGIGQLTGGKFYTLDRSILRTSVLTEGGTVNNQVDFEKGIDVDFDTGVFNLPQRVRGTVNTGMTWSLVGGGGAVTFQGYVIVKLVHVDAASAETILATMQSDTLTSGTSTTPTTDFMQATVVEKLVKVGEKLRVTAEVWWFQSGGTSQGAVPATLYVDPLNAVSADTLAVAGKSQFFVDIPFRIDL